MRIRTYARPCALARCARVIIISNLVKDPSYKDLRSGAPWAAHLYQQVTAL
jgi:hypothetical protein